MTQNNQTKPSSAPANLAPKRPNENGTINVEGFIKIFDPTTKETFVEKRA
jgi:hypothetical protein